MIDRLNRHLKADMLGDAVIVAGAAPAAALSITEASATIDLHVAISVGSPPIFQSLVFNGPSEPGTLSGAVMNLYSLFEFQNGSEGYPLITTSSMSIRASNKTEII